MALDCQLKKKKKKEGALILSAPLPLCSFLSFPLFLSLCVYLSVQVFFTEKENETEDKQKKMWTRKSKNVERKGLILFFPSYRFAFILG